MPRTPDSFPGIDQTDGICFYDDGYGLPGCEREIRYSDGYFYAQDAYGIFNIRVNVHPHISSHLGYADDSFYVISDHSPTINDDGYEIGHRWIDDIDGYEFVLIDNTEGAAIWRNTTLSGGAGGIPGTHGYTHISEASDEIDGDKLDINFDPTYYIPNTDPIEVDSINELSGHLSGIDAYLGDLGNTKLDIEDHRTLRHLIHFIDEGPGNGFVSGATRQIIGGVFPTQVIWKTYDGNNLVIKTITRNDNQTPSIIEWKMYDVDGVSVLATITDTITYNGIFEISRTRSIS